MKFAVIGHPIAHSLSPVMHEANFSALGRDDTYEALDIPPEQFDDIKDIIASRNLDGFNITIPHKERILPYLDDIDVQARDLGAVNTVKIVDGQWIGYNTDGIGYVKGLQSVYPDLANAYILILGAGGASKGIANVLDHVVKPKLSVANRTMQRFDNWDLDVNKLTLQQAEAHLSEFDIIINTTPAGMSSNRDVVISLDQLDERTLVSDIIYTPSKTAFLLQAEANGNEIYNGLDMFINQGAESFRIWTGEAPNTEAMKQTVIKHLEGE